MRTACLVAAALLVSCASPTPEEADAARRGRADAERDVELRRPRFAAIGLLPDDESPLDLSTGLVKFSVGCCKTYERIAYCDAYNGVFDDARRAGRLAGATLERKATTRAAIAATFAGGGAVIVRLGGGVDAPGGRFRVEAAPGGPYEPAALWCVDRTSNERRELRYLGGDRAAALFDDGGATLFVRDDAAHVYAVFDLPSALTVQVFRTVSGTKPTPHAVGAD